MCTRTKGGGGGSSEPRLTPSYSDLFEAVTTKHESLIDQRPSQRPKTITAENASVAVGQPAPACHAYVQSRQQLTGRWRRLCWGRDLCTTCTVSHMMGRGSGVGRRDVVGLWKTFQNAKELQVFPFPARSRDCCPSLNLRETRVPRGLHQR